MFGNSCSGADDRNRTGDLVLTKDALCQLSYIGEISLQFSVVSSQNQWRLAEPTLASPSSAAKAGAGDGDRTRDQQLGRL